jgi:phage/plasmid-associated DNA primase
MDIFPDASKCPRDIFNLWKPFRIDLYKGEYTTNSAAADKILKHIMILCNHQKEVYDYIILWIAHMLKYPSKKSIVPTFISKQGAGKGTLMKLLSKLLGEKRVLETTTPSRDVWGNFNGMMPTKFLINLNELSRKETMESEGRIKALITDPTLTINSKGVNQYEIQSYHRFIITTNNEQPIATSDDDRRNLIIRCSDELLKNSEYFIEMHGLLEDEAVIRTIGDAFKDIVVKANFNEYPIPHTRYQDDLKEASRPYHELWLAGFANESSKQDEVSLYPNEVFADYKRWCERNGYIIDGMNSTKLGIRLNNIFPPDVRNNYITTALNGKHKKTFYIPKLLEFFNDTDYLDEATETDEESVGEIID